jgi:hypothetical protein
MELLGHVEFDRQGWHLDRRDIGEGEEGRPAQAFKPDADGRVEADVEHKLIEHATGQLRPHVIPNRGALDEPIEHAGALDGKVEEIAQVCRLSGQ